MNVVLAEFVQDYREMVTDYFFPGEPEKEFEFLSRIDGCRFVYRAQTRVMEETGPVLSGLLTGLQEIFDDPIE